MVEKVSYNQNCNDYDCYDYGCYDYDFCNDDVGFGFDVDVDSYYCYCDNYYYDCCYNYYCYDCYYYYYYSSSQVDKLIEEMSSLNQMLWLWQQLFQLVDLNHCEK